MKNAFTTILTLAALATTALTVNGGALWAERGILPAAALVALAAVLAGQTIPALLLLLGAGDKEINRPNAAAR
ncbi:hypothetical protein GMLC_17360 [Geomonas limicola]|uniref:Uncharacterized protein n=1 Tax=Geomonas limicola TaxID=2740186 RepID=A0A6V8N8R1_9BACT|nr:hypothetical protein [Geomonas limicola]GFO68157.1 hypothetical protein GMLC_17360 [Geomonas limicola]